MHKKTSQAIGIYGGTFDPIHHGHLLSALEAIDRLGLRRVIFVPAYCQPLKRRLITGPDERLKMVRLATAGRLPLEVSDYEIRQKGPSYTYKTINYFRSVYGKKARLFFLAGSDCLKSLARWKNVDDLLAECTFVVFDRPPAPSGLKQKWRKKLKYLNIPPVNISSTYIRRRIRKKQPVDFMVPPLVKNYILRKKIYT